MAAMVVVVGDLDCPRKPWKTIDREIREEREREKEMEFEDWDRICRERERERVSFSE